METSGTGYAGWNSARQPVTEIAPGGKEKIPDPAVAAADHLVRFGELHGAPALGTGESRAQTHLRDLLAALVAKEGPWQVFRPAL